MRKLVWLIALMMTVNVVTASIIPFHQRIAASSGVLVMVGTPAAEKTVQVTASTGTYVDVFLDDYVTLGVDYNHPTNKFFGDGFNLEVDVLIQPLSGTPIPKTLIIDYKPFGMEAHKDKDIHHFTGVDDFTFTITGIRKDGIAVTELPENIFVDGDILVNRAFDFSADASTPIVFQPGAITLIDSDCDPDTDPDQITITWPTVTSAIEYQLEWTFVNDYDGTRSAGIPGVLPPAALEYNFRSNSTRISTVFNSYSIPLIFEHGYLMFRVRAIGMDPSSSTPNAYIFGVWSEPTPQGPLTSFITAPSNANAFILNNSEFEYRMNWQCTTTFAEEGKKKEVLSLYDGSLRNRQSITVINTDNNAIVGETIYDAQGRPAINVLPVPVECPTGGNAVFKHYPNFNRNLSEVEYSRLDFDLDVGFCNSPTSKMSPNTSGAARYYSALNPEKDAHQAFVPESNGVPFTQIEYTPDNTGRVRRQSGVGEEFMLGTDHETKYFYGTPFQLQLDRLFASEVGYASHYKKNMVVDPNGQISVSYLDQEGRVIATSLAGEIPQNLQAIPSALAAEIDLEADLFGPPSSGSGTSNNITPEGDGYFYSQEILVSSPGEYEFTYDMNVDAYTDPCTPGLCFNCVFDLEIKVTDECGLIVEDLLGNPVHFVALEGHFTTNTDGDTIFTTDCLTDPYLSGPYNWTALLGVGNYTVTKTLTVNEDAIDFAFNEYIDPDNNDCILTLEDFEDAYLANVDLSGCDPSCDDCVLALGEMDDFVAQGFGTAQDWQDLVDQCMEPCIEKSFCEVAYELMLSDMSPGGQYGAYQSTAGVNNVSGQPVSVYNVSNILDGHWKTPMYDDGTTIQGYYPDDNGDQARVYVTVASGALNSVPAVGSFPSQVFTETGTGLKYTYPRFLDNVYNFINEFEPSWAQALIMYHPEYCYYDICKDYSNEDGSGNSSDGFDISMNAAHTYAAAQGNGFIDVSGNIVDYTNTGSSQYDPYITDNNYPPYSGATGLLAQAISGYITIGSITYSMAEFASIVTFCPSALSGTGPIPPSCPTEYLTSTDVTLQNDWWRRFVGLYQGKKRELQNDYADEQAITGLCFNDCIGDDNFNPFTSGFWQPGTFPTNVTNTWLSLDQPCSAFYYGFYSGKTKRFPDTDDLGGAGDIVNAQYQMYLQTGQCPNAYNLQALLSEIAQAGELDNPNAPLTNYSTFAALHVGLTNIIGPNPLPAWEWNTTNTAGVLKVEWTDPTDPLFSCTISIDGTGSITNWDDILGFGQLQSTGLVGSDYTFTIVALIDDGLGGTTTVNLTGTTSCFDIENCQFPPECEPNELASSIEQIMTLLAQEGELDNTTGYAFGTQPVYPSLTSLMLTNTVSAPTTSLTWTFDTGLINGTIGSSGDAIFLDFTSATPPAFGGISSIAYFDNMQSNNQHYFSIDAYDTGGNFLTTLAGEAYIDDGVTQEPLEMGSCELPNSVFCEEEAHFVLEDLYALLGDVLLQNPFDANIDIFSSPQITSLITGYFDPTVVMTSGTETQTSGTTGGFDNTLVISTVEGEPCDIVLSFNAPTSATTFEDIIALESIMAVPPINNFNSFNDFEIVATFDDGAGGTFSLVINGTSCLPIKNCEICDPEEEESECEILYQQYVDAYNAMVASGSCPHIPALLSLQDFIDGNYCCNEEALSSFALFIQNFSSQPCGISAKALPPCEGEGSGKLGEALPGDPIKSDGRVKLENSAIELAKLEQSVTDLNAREGFVAGTSDYVQAPTLKETIVNDYANFYDAYSAYLDNYNASVDNPEYLYSIDEFIREYGYCTNVTMEYERYVASVNEYNLRATAQGVAPMVPVNETTFKTEGLGCHCTDYINYLESCPMGATPATDLTSYLVASGAIDPTAIADACELAYQQYLIAYEGFISNNPNSKICAEFTPLITKADFVKRNLCTTDGLVFFQEYIASFADMTSCPQAIPTYRVEAKAKEIGQEECRKRYESYVALINAYNNSPYAQAMHHSLIPASLEAFLLRYCECLEAYAAYLRPYLVDPPDLDLPLPTGIEKFEGCQEEPPVNDPCDDAYADYIEVIGTYNQYVVKTGNGWPLIKVEYLESEFTVNGLCYCVEAYVAYLNALIAGHEDVPATDQEFAQLLDLATHCDEAPCTPDTPPGIGLFEPITFDLEDPCVEQALSIALQNAGIAYQAYIDSVAEEFVTNFTNHCLGVNENFILEFTDKEYHFTLYYYDQAGNLIKTIPPEGVEFVNTTSSSDAVSLAIANDRLTNTQTKFTFHRLETKYLYNSLNQLVKQCLPDHDKMDVCNLTLPNGLDSRFRAEEVQFITSSRGYVAGWMNYSGNRRGALYETNDGGGTWTKVDHTVASDLQAIQWIDDGADDKAYAIGKHGVLVRSDNGGYSWDMVDLYGDNIFTQLNDLVLDNSESGLLVGNNGLIVDYSPGSATVPTLSFPTGYPINSDDHITSIVQIGSEYYITVDYTDASGSYGMTYRSTSGTSWEALHKVQAPALNDVQFVDNTTAVAVGNNGLLIKTVDGGNNWFVQSSSDKETMSAVFFKDANNGVAIRGAGLLYATHDGGNTWIVLDPSNTYNDLMAYDPSPGTAKLVAAGNSGVVTRVILMSGTAGIHGIPTGSSVNFTSVWAAMSGSQVYVAAGGNSPSIYYSTNAGVASVSWTNTPPTSLSPIKSLAFDVVGLDLNGSAITGAGSLHGVFINTTLNTAGVSGVLTTGAEELVNRNTANAIFASAGSATYEIVTSGPTPPATATLYQNITSGNTQSDIAVNSNDDILLVNGTGNIDFIPGTGTQVDQTFYVRPRSLADGAESTNTYTSVGENGQVVRIDLTTSTNDESQVLPNIDSDDFNAIHANGSDVMVVGDNSSAYKVAGTTFTGLSVIGDLTDVHLDNLSTNGYIVSAQGGIYYTSGYGVPTPTFVNVPNTNSTAFNAIDVAQNGTTVYVGDESKVYIGNTLAANETKEVYTPEFRDVHFKDQLNGYVIGDEYTVRRTSDGGNTWNVVLQTGGFPTGVPELDGVETLNSSQAILIGRQKYVASSNGVSASQLPITSIPGSNAFPTGGYRLRDITFTSPTVGFIVGGGGTGRAWQTTDGGVTWAAIGPNPTSGLRAIHGFTRNNTFMATGNNGVVAYWDGSALSTTIAPQTFTGNDLYDIYFHDDVNGYLVGEGGIMLKSKDGNLDASSGLLLSMNWVDKSIDDDLLGQSNEFIKDVWTIGFATRYNGFFGGEYGGNPKGLWRLINDESEEFSTYFWYDELGRIVVSQNSKQYNAADQRYSYTRYDFLGRVVEAGEKVMDDPSNPTFASIFGTYVSGLYNPKVIDDQKLTDWIEGAGTRQEITHSYYDNPIASLVLPGTFSQGELRKRIASITYEKVFDNDETTFDYGTHYDYDVHGNVRTLLQDNQELSSDPDPDVAAQQFKRLDYEYDLISGNVNEVSYQDGEVDSWYHRYDYDADNRILDVETSADKVTWDMDCKYEYYDHGPLARTETGELNVQGTDYAYTLQGWLKGVNSNNLNADNDMGRDGNATAFGGGSNPNEFFARDVFGYSLGYYEGDYSPIETGLWTTANAFIADASVSDLKDNRNDLFNGNIGSMVTSIVDPPCFTPLGAEQMDVRPQGTAYLYDQLNRIKEARAFQNLDIDPVSSTFNTWDQAGTYDNKYFNSFVYDASGNILEQERRDDNGDLIDQLEYQYARVNGLSTGAILQNRLYGVTETVPDGNYPDDIDDMPINSIDIAVANNGLNNYRYDAIGQLIQDLQEEIDTIEWRVDNKISRITRIPGSLKSDLEFDYDPLGNRVAKHEYDNSGNWIKSTYYVRDAQGNVMVVYTHEVDGTSSTASYHVDERNIYGSSRIGMSVENIEMIGATTSNSFYHTIGDKRYECSNHLGNVLTVITDAKIPRDENNDGTIDYSQPTVMTSWDYSPFGVLLYNRQYEGKKEVETTTTVETEIENQDFESDPTGVGVTPSGWSVNTGIIGVKP